MLLDRLKPTDDDLTEYDPIKLYFDLQGRMTQSDYAYCLGISERTLQRWLKGEQKPDNLVPFRRAGQLRKQWSDRPGWIT